MPPTNNFYVRQGKTRIENPQHLFNRVKNQHVIVEKHDISEKFGE